MPVFHGMRDRFIEGRRHASCVAVTIYQDMRDRFIESLKAPSKGRMEQKRDSSCAGCMPIYHGMRDRFIEGRRHASWVTVTIYHGV